MFVVDVVVDFDVVVFSIDVIDDGVAAVAVYVANVNVVCCCCCCCNY